MENIQVDDINLLNDLENDISNIEKEIENLPVVKKLHEKEIDIKNLQKRIMKYSTYDVEQIGNVLAKLMTAFEGISYYLTTDYWTSGYCIEPISLEISNIHIYKHYKFDKLKQKKSLFNYYFE